MGAFDMLSDDDPIKIRHESYQREDTSPRDALVAAVVEATKVFVGKLGNAQAEYDALQVAVQALATYDNPPAPPRTAALRYVATCPYCCEEVGIGTPPLPAGFKEVCCCVCDRVFLVKG